MDREEYIEYQLSKPLWIKDHPEYNQYLNTVRPISWDAEGQINRFSKDDEPINWDEKEEVYVPKNWCVGMIVGPQELARIITDLPPMPPVVPITDEQMKSWFQPWEIITQHGTK